MWCHAPHVTSGTQTNQQTDHSCLAMSPDTTTLRRILSLHSTFVLISVFHF